MNEADAAKPKTLVAEKDKILKPILPKADIMQNLSNDPTLIFEFDPAEFARQMTLLEFDLYTKVPSYECVDQIWEGKILKETAAYKFPKSPHSKRANPGSSFSAISTLIQHTNDVILINKVYILGCNISCKSRNIKGPCHCSKVCYSGRSSL